jgi:hypothetical protein
MASYRNTHFRPCHATNSTGISVALLYYGCTAGYSDPPAQTGGRLPRPAIDGQRKEHTPLLELPGAQKWTGGARQQQAPWPAGRATALSKTRFSNLRMAWPLGHEHTAAAGAPALVTVLPSRASNGPGRAPTFTISSQTFFHSQL